MENHCHTSLWAHTQPPILLEGCRRPKSLRMRKLFYSACVQKTPVGGLEGQARPRIYAAIGINAVLSLGSKPSPMNDHGLG
ncbi:hypothetical protein EMIT0P4_470002 [Pseudomonas sp. IT-P4]